MGIQVAWLVWFVRLTSCAANANLFVIYLGEFWPRATQPFPKLAILTLLIGILAAINVRGVRTGTRVSNVFTVAKLSSLGPGRSGRCVLPDRRLTASFPNGMVSPAA